MTSLLEPTPWDKRNFHIDTYQLTEYTEAALKETNEVEGHFTVKVDPLANTAHLKKYGFYYADTLTEPACHKGQLVKIDQDDIQFTRDYDEKDILKIAEEAFSGFESGKETVAVTFP